MKQLKLPFKQNINSVFLSKIYTAIIIGLNFIVFSPTTVLSQKHYYDQYTPLKSLGLIPNDFKGQASSDYTNELKGIEMDNTLTSSEKKKLAKKRLTIIYQLDNLLN